jgi:hypothetical protein
MNFFLEFVSIRFNDTFIFHSDALIRKLLRFLVRRMFIYEQYHKYIVENGSIAGQLWGIIQKTDKNPRFAMNSFFM